VWRKEDSWRTIHDLFLTNCQFSSVHVIDASAYYLRAEGYGDNDDAAVVAAGNIDTPMSSRARRFD
jgi:hypothetical protein